jgi:hypothetical protein
MKKIAEEERYDGFYAICINLDDNAEAIVKININAGKSKNAFAL